MVTEGEVPKIEKNIWETVKCFGRPVFETNLTEICIA